MASGSFQGGGSYVIAKINWSSSAGTGGSNVSATLIAQNINYTYVYANLYGGYNVTINGNKKSGSGAALSSSQNGAATLLSHTVWVGYTGNKSIGISGYFNGNGISISGANLGERSCSSTVALDKVGSVPSVPAMTAPATTTVAENTTKITVKWNASTSYNNSGNYRVDVSINGGAYTWVSGDLAWGTTSWTYTIPTANRTQGATFKFQVCCGNDVGWSSHSYSGTVTLNKLNAPTIGTINTYNPYQTSALTVPLSGGSQTNGDTAFTRRADLYQGSTRLASCASPSNGNTSASITYAAANYATRLGSKAYSGTFRIVAWIQNSRGARSRYVEKNFTVNLNLDGNAKPTLGSVTISGGTLGYPASCFITGISSLGVSLGNATLNRAPSGTTLTYKVSCTGGGEKTGQSVNFGSLSAGVKDITITVTDSRGLSNSTTRQVRFQAYTNPAITNMKAQRVDNEQTSATITYRVTYCNIYAYSTNVSTQGAQLNGISYQKYQLNGADNWIDHTSGGKITGLSTDMPYTFNLCIADKVKTSNWIYSSVIIPTVKKFMSWRKWGVGLGCVPENGYTLDVSGKTRLRSDVNISHKNSSWMGGTDNGTINFVGAVNSSDYFPMLSAKTTSGHRISLGVYKDTLKLISLKSDRTINGYDHSITFNPTSGSVSLSGDLIVINDRATQDGSPPHSGGVTSISSIQELKNYRSIIGSMILNGTWNNVISVRHRNGYSDGQNYGMYIRTILQGDSSLAWGKQTDASTWVGDKIILDNYNYLSYTRHYHYKFKGIPGATGWVHLGDISDSDDTLNTFVKVYGGPGYNGRSDQNSIINIQIKDGWQSTVAAAQSQGVTWWCDGSYHNSIQVKVMATSNSAYQIWIYMPWNYSDGNYEVYTEANYTHVNESQTSAPTSGTAQNVKNITPDMRGYPVGAVIPFNGSSNPANLYGGTWTEVNNGIACKAHSGYYINNSGNTAANNNNIVLYAWDGTAANKWNIRMVEKDGSNTFDTRWWQRTA